MNLPEDSVYEGKSIPTDKGPCAKDKPYKTGNHIAVMSEWNDEYVGSIGQCPCVPAEGKKEEDRYKVINP
ncbi:hypothetical protein [Archangium violaceum]|uniref:hypothetical protein n=1 Tax=Archangium violaceum TaxID=83451 RepID=UPI0037C0FF24